MTRFDVTVSWITCVFILASGRAGYAATLTLAWDPDPETEIAGYLLEYGTQPGVYTNSVDVGNRVSQEVVGLAEGATYYFVVRAYNTMGVLSDPSQEVGGQTPLSAPPPAIPDAPSAPVPSDTAGGLATTTALVWASAANATHYDVLFGMSSTFIVISTDQTSPTYQLPPLNGGTTYYWQVVAKGPGGSRSGPIWSFTTGLQAPAVPSAPTPANGAIEMAPPTLLAWTAAMYATEYDVLFGFGSALLAVSTNQVQTTYQLPPLVPGIRYSWQIVAKGPGGWTSGPVWSFTAGPPPPSLPWVPTPPAPEEHPETSDRK